MASAGSQHGAIPPPPGVTPNLENPKDELNTVLLVTQALCIAFVTVFVFLRIFVKVKILQNFAREDYVCLISWLLCIAYCVVGIFMSKAGAGYNLWDIDTATMTAFLKRGYIATIVYMPMAFMVKLALLMILARVFGPYKKTVIFVYVFLAVLFGYYAAGFVVKVRTCYPIPAYWHGDKSKCLNQRAIIISDSIASVASDMIILLLPLPLTWSLQMDVKKKLRVMGILGAGGLATCFSIYRLAMIVQTGNSLNQTMVFTRVVLSGNAEIGIGLICACLPALNALFENRRSESSRQYEYGSRGYPGNYKLSKVGGTVTNSQPTTSRNKDDIGSDKDRLITNAQSSPEFETSVAHGGNGSSIGSRRKSFKGNGILKTVAVSHAYEVSER